MCWHFWKCKQTLWLWISTGWGLKSIHPLKSHCTKALKSYNIQRDETAELFFFFFFSSCSVSSDLSDLLHLSLTSTVSLPSCCYKFIYRLTSSHRVMLHEGRKEKSLQQVTKNSNYVLQWSTTDETGAGVALKPQDTMIHSIQQREKNDRGALMCTQLQTQRHIWMHMVRNDKNDACKL